MPSGSATTAYIRWIDANQNEETICVLAPHTTNGKQMAYLPRVQNDAEDLHTKTVSEGGEDKQYLRAVHTDSIEDL